MRNLFILAIVVFLGYLVYQRFIHRDPPTVRMYKTVVQAWIDGDMSIIRPICEEPRLEAQFEVRSLRRLLEPVGVSNIVDVKYQNLTQSAGSLATESRIISDVEIFFNPPNVKSEHYASFRAVFRYELGLRQVGEIWKLTSFDVERKEMGEFRYK